MLLHRCFKDSKFASQAFGLIREDVFDTEPFKWCVRKMLGGFTTVRILASELKHEKDLMNESLRKAIGQELKGFLKPFNEDESRYAIENLREFVESQDVHESLRDAAKIAADGGRAKQVREILHKAVFSARSTKNVTINPIETIMIRFTEREKIAKNGELVYTSCGFKSIDMDIKGPKPGQFWVIFGDTNLGKSHGAVAAGIRNMLTGFPVLHFPIEDLLEVTLQRYDAALTNITHDRLTAADLNDDEKERVEKVVNLLLKQRANFLRVSKVEEGSTINELWAELKRLQAKEDFFPKVVLIDSPHDMDPVMRQENFRLGQRRLYKEIRDFAQRENVAVIAYDQSKQEVKGKVADTSAASESYDKARIVDGFITMNQSKIQRKDGIIELFTAKMKDRTKHKSYLIRPNFAKSRFQMIERRSEG